MQLELETTGCPLCGEDRKEEHLAGVRDYEYRTVENSFRYVRCAGCGLLYLDPRPRPEDVPLTYPPSYEQYAVGMSAFSPKRAVQALRTELVLKPRMRRLLKPLRGTDPVRILDVGCGNGHSLAAARAVRPGAELHGVDLGESQRALLEARGIAYHQGRFEELDLPAEHFDLIVLNHVIEHFLDPLAVVRKARECLAPGGELYLETHVEECLERRLFGPYWIGFDAPRHLTVFGRESTRRLLADGGLEVLRCPPILSIGDVIYSLRRRVAATPATAFLKPLVSDKNPLLLALSWLLNAPRSVVGRTSVIGVIAGRA